MSAKRYEEFCPEMSELPEIFDDHQRYMVRLLEHIVDQAKGISDEDSRMFYWSQAKTHAELGLGWFQGLKESLRGDHQELAQMAMHFYWLGKTTAELEQEPISDRLLQLQDYLRLKESEHKERRPLIRREIGLSVLKDSAQREAHEIWASDTEEEFRIGEVAKLVQEELLRRIDFSGWPTDCPGVETVKRWLREVAPEYAMRGGRPKK